MKPGMMGGVVVCCLLVIPFSVLASDVQLFVNGASVSLESPVLGESDSLLVPLQEFGALIGIHVDPSEDGQELLLRWSERRATFGADVFSSEQGVSYAWLSWLVGLVDGALHRVGAAVYVMTEQARLIEIDAEEDRVILRLDRYAPEALARSEDGLELCLTFSNCGSNLPLQRTILGGQGFESVELHASNKNRVVLTLRFTAPSSLHLVRREAAGYYSVTLRTAAAEESESILELAEGTELHELVATTALGTIRADYLTVDSWRSRYRLVPAYPAIGLGSGESVDAIAREAGADVAIGLVPYEAAASILVIGGVPLAAEPAEHMLFSVDLFGRWTVDSSTIALCAEHCGTRISIDDVNRPIAYGEAIGYPPGYSGTIVRGVPGSFRVIKVRSERVVSVYEGPFVSADPTATLIVASGEAKARFSLVELGDAIRLGCDWSSGDRTIVHAFESGPMIVRDGVVDGEVLGDGEMYAVLATDWHGGMTLLTLTCDALDAEQDLTPSILDVLGRLDAPTRSAAVLSRGFATGLAVRNPYDFDRLGAADPFSLALCLVPLNP